MSTGIVTIATPPRIAIRSAMTTNVYGRRSASLTIHMMVSGAHIMLDLRLPVPWPSRRSAKRPSQRSRIEAQKGAHAIQLRLEFALERAVARRVRFDKAELRRKLTILHG